MSKRVIYISDEGHVALLVPSPEALSVHGIMAIALKDVPAGKPFKIFNTADLPEDMVFFGAWEVDEADLTDGVGAESNEFPPIEEATQ